MKVRDAIELLQRCDPDARLCVAVGVDGLAFKHCLKWGAEPVTGAKVIGAGGSSQFVSLTAKGGAECAHESDVIEGECVRNPSMPVKPEA